LHVDVSAGSRVGDDDITTVALYNALKLAPTRHGRESVPRAKNDAEV
jgi:hypothetical protein